ncbi:hypothetical protein BTA51_14215 [Hahella sp. CCB-MM4]|uniref:hypothetical protein n=1 Tax=Hahella sp. (strain CCB-MM4) TaxID=1926491 RepID=UPI000B9B9EA3|nr:hypothetical protein [Hahella sp. CCB-MM4]OZG72680.1 hypothetical protein BTA51_14215 [Hahella sp. CCB-MM4]
MNAIFNTLDAYGRSMGINGFGQGNSTLKYESGERITLDHREDYLLVSLSYELPEYELGEMAEKLLHLSHFRHSTDYRIQPGILGERQLILSVRINPEEASIHYLDGAIRRLRSRYQELTGGIGKS